MKIQKDINTAQIETINIFAEAVNLNKSAVEQKQKELDLMEEADRTTDESKKNKLVKEAEKLRKSSQKNEAASKSKVHGSTAKDIGCESSYGSWNR
ncbi:MAG: hypothetical protein IPO49_10795 [Bacteroidetes bacterium]|nr:hypothetical protein [Bacteroidota bacterium]